MSTPATKRLVVCGGNGFIGSRICKHAVSRGWSVTSISRSGDPKWSAITSSPNPPSWSKSVSWQKGDLLRPATYSAMIAGADYVVHSMGILLETDYKRAVSGQESPLSALQRSFAAGPQPGNPLQRGVDHKDKNSDIRPPETKEQLTYENMNRDSAISLAKIAHDAGVKGFAYMSAAGGAPILPARYINTKREAEATVTKEFGDKMRGVYIRAPMMYDSSRPITMAMAGMTGMGAVFNGLTRGVMGGFMGAAGVKPLKADTVAMAVVEALEDEAVKGPVEVPQIEDLANRAWRKGML